MQYVNRCSIEVNGAVYEDFASVTIEDRTVGKTVNLMNKTGFAKMTPRYNISLTVKKPYTGDIDLDNIVGGTMTVEYDNGQRELYRGFSTLTTGAGTLDGETELTFTKTFMATERETEN